MSEPVLSKFIRNTFEDGTLAVLRTPEELEVLLKASPGCPQDGSATFLTTQIDELNELCLVEVLAGKPYASRAQHAQDLTAGVKQLQPWEDDINGKGYTNGMHESQWRILNLPVEERVAKVLHVVRFREQITPERGD